jgi:hypothetical protein
VLKDFNIKEVAGDSNVPAVKNDTVNVTENFLEVHFFLGWKGNLLRTITTDTWTFSLSN